MSSIASLFATLMLWTYPIPQSTLWPLNSYKIFRYHLHLEHWVDIPCMATAHRKHQMWCFLAGYFHSRCFHRYFLWQLYSEERFGSAMLIDFSKKPACWLLFCYQETSSNWTLAELKRKQESLQLTIIIKEITIQRWWNWRTLISTIIRNAPIEKECLLHLL